MQLFMTTLEHKRADVAVREKFSFSERRIRELLPVFKKQNGAFGAVLLCTCSRTELYLASEIPVSPTDILCAAVQVVPADYPDAFIELQGEDAARHLMEVACGLRSQILCEDQIITQVNTASTIARESGSHNSLLETVFRLAVTAAKKAKSEVTVHAVPHSSAERAVELIKERFSDLSGRSVMVIGNGEMGRTCASMLRESGCRTIVTLRTYRHGENTVPFGCETIPYDRRCELLPQCDAVVSATASPHYTLTADMFTDLPRMPELLVDLAMPRDIDPALESLIPCLNIDHMVTSDELQTENAEAIAHIHSIIEEYISRYRQWLSFHEEEGVLCSNPPSGCGGYMPLFLPSAGRKALVVGAGRIAARRAAVLLRFGLRVTVIAPDVSTELALLEKEGRLTVLHRKADPRDVTADLFLVVAASSDRECNHAIGAAAREAGIPVSVADCKEESTFYFPAIIEGGGVVAGLISVDGSDHRLAAKQAKRLRETLEFPPEE